MNIKQDKKKNGTIVYRTRFYLGVDQVTGKKARTTIPASTKKGVKIKARDALNNFAMNGYTVKEKPTLTTSKDLTALWWESYKNTVKPNPRQSMEGMVTLHILTPFGTFKLSRLPPPFIKKQFNKVANNPKK
ncbi:tyrosine-type recombinase/integrase, partial [Streptococcus dysgalactiae]